MNPRALVATARRVHAQAQHRISPAQLRLWPNSDCPCPAAPQRVEQIPALPVPRMQAAAPLEQEHLQECLAQALRLLAQPPMAHCPPAVPPPLPSISPKPCPRPCNKAGCFMSRTLAICTLGNAVWANCSKNRKI